MKKMKKGMSVLAVVVIMISLIKSDVYASSITVPEPEDPNAAIHRVGIVTYYNYNLQPWKKMDGGVLYSYRGKKTARYYKPIYYLSNFWMANNGNDIEVTLTSSKEKSVTSIVSSTLGVETTSSKVKLATSVSSSYSETAKYSTSYATKYVFNMKKYSDKHTYRPAAFGRIMEYSTLRKNRITQEEHIYGNTYTFNKKYGFDLRLAWR